MKIFRMIVQQVIIQVAKRQNQETSAWSKNPRSLHFATDIAADRYQIAKLLVVSSIKSSCSNASISLNARCYALHAPTVMPAL